MLNIKKFNGYAIAIIFFVITILLSIKTCSDWKEKNKLSQSLKQLIDTNSKLEIFVDELGRENAKVNVIEIPKDAIEQTKENQNLKTLETKVFFKTITQLDTIKVYLLDTFFVEQGDTTPMHKFNYNDNWLMLGGKIINDTLSFDSILVKNEFNIEIGKERKWLLGKENTTIYITNNNPHTHTKDVLTYKVLEDKKWYQKDGFKYGLGAIGTFLLLR
jgi:hypothetical protein